MNKAKLRCLSLLALLSVLLVLLGAGYPEKTALTVVTPETLAKSGEEFAVLVDIENNPGLCAAQFTLRYDAGQVLCIGADAGEVMDDMLWESNPEAPDGAMIAAAAVQPAEGDGTLAEYSFIALTDLTEWPFALADISLADAEKAEIPYTTGPSSLQEDGDETETELPPVDDEDAGTAEETREESPATGQEVSFSDIGGHWGEAYVKEAAEMGLFGGYPDGSFRPDQTITRGDFVLVLWRMAGKPAPTTASPFTDVTPGGYYYEAILWAYEQGIVKGISDTAFAPDSMLTREQAMTILFRFDGGMSGMEMFFTSSYDAAFRDSGEISDWARSAMYWGVFQKLIEGTAPDTLSPQMNATRVQLAKILVNYVNMSL